MSLVKEITKVKGYKLIAWKGETIDKNRINAYYESKFLIEEIIERKNNPIKKLEHVVDRALILKGILEEIEKLEEKK